MKYSRVLVPVLTVFLAGALLAWALLPVPASPSSAGRTTGGRLATPASALPAVHSLEIPFVENRGQLSAPGVKYYAQTLGQALFVTQDGQIVYALANSVQSPLRRLPTALTVHQDQKGRGGSGSKAATKPSQGFPVETESDVRGWTIAESFVGASVSNVRGEQKARTAVSYFKGTDPTGWQRNLSTYQSVSLGEIYEGIEVRLKAYASKVEKLFYVQPGANPEKIRVRIAGANGLHVSTGGDLEIETGLGTVQFTEPVAYQEVDEHRRYVEIAYVVDGDEYGFAVGPYDTSRELVIDPILNFTYLGGSVYEYANAVATDAAGNVYVAGWTESTDFPTAGSPYSASSSGYVDVFVAKLDASLTTLLAATYLGGSSGDWARSLALDPAGNVYVVGTTDSGDFPTPGGTYDTDFNGSAHDVFVAKLDGNLQNLLAATYLGGGGREDAFAMAIDARPSVTQTVVVAGRTASSDFPTSTGAYTTTLSGQYDAFVSRLDENLQTLVASTYLGGGEIDAARAVTVTTTGEVYVAGYTASAGFPTTAGAYQAASQGGYDAFVAKLDANLQNVTASTHLGGSDRDYAYALALDGSGNVYVGGISRSSTFPTTGSAYQTAPGGGYDAYVAKLDGNLGSLPAATFLGGSGEDYAYALAVGRVANSPYVFLTGATWSSDFPTTGGAYDPSFNGGQLYGGYADAFASKFNADLSTLPASTYLGGSGYDEARAIAIAPGGEVYVAGHTWSSDFSTASGADNTLAGTYDAFAARLDGDLSSAAPPPTVSVSPTSHDFGEVDVGSTSVAQTFTMTNTGTAALTPTITITGTWAPDFQTQNNTCSGQSLLPSATCTVQVVFSPSNEGTESARLLIGSTDPGMGTLDVPLSGTGTAESYTLTVNRITGMGRVRSLDRGISCGTDCTESYGAGSQVTLRAYPLGGATFAGWSGGGCSGTGDCTLTLNADTAVTATFTFPLPDMGADANAVWYVAAPETAVDAVLLRRGWNLVSLPYQPLGTTNIISQVASVQDNLDAVWGWDETQSAWRVYSPGVPVGEVTQRCDAGVLPLERLEGGHGYWFQMAVTDTLYLEADSQESTPPVSGAGWHLTGVDRTAFEGGGLITPTQVLSTTFAVTGTLWAWDADQQSWRVFSTDASLSNLQQQYGANLLPLNSLGPRNGFWMEIPAQEVQVFQAPDPNPRGMFYDGQYLYVQGLHNRQTYRLNPDTGAVLASFNQGLGGTDATWDGQYAWGMGWSVIQKTRVESGRLVPVAQYEMRPYLHHMAGIAWDGEFLWLGGFFRVDPDHISQQEILEETDSGLGYITQMEWVNGLLYALDGSHYLYVLDPNDPRGPFQIAQMYALPGEKPSGLAWDGANLWVSDEDAGRIYKIPGNLLGGRSYDLMDDYLRPGEAATHLGGSITGDTTLSKSGSPYVLDNGLDVASGVTLTIEPGVRLLFPQYVGVSVNGRIVAVGTPQEPIVFSHVDPDTRWSGIMVNSESDPSQQSVFRYCRIQHAERGIEARNATLDVQHCWMRGMPTGLNAPPAGIQIEVANGADAQVAGNVAPNIAMYLGSGNPAQVTVEDNRGSFIFLRSGYTANPTSVRRNLLDGGIVVEGATNLEMEGNQLGRPLECNPTADAPVTFNSNLIETDYQINGLCRDGTHFTARHNTVTNGFSVSWNDLAADLLSLLDVHYNNILGGANYFLPAEVNIASTQTVDLSQNWWGTTDANEVRELINDHEDDSNRGSAPSDPVLTAPDPYGFVRGRVFDVESRRPLSEATVEISGTNEMVAADGTFATTLPAGTYTVTVAASGYQTATLTNVTVAAASVTHLEGGLLPAGSTPASPQAAQAEPATAYPPQPPAFPPGYGVPGVPACRTTCPDLDGDRQVGIADIQAVVARWRLTAADPDPDGDPGTPNYGAAFDGDGDGVITVVDIMRVAARWNQSCQ